MSNPREVLVRCRHCRADNPVDASHCWLCEAGDWNPSLYGPGTPKGTSKAPAHVHAAAPDYATDGDGSELGMIFTAIAMIGVTVLIAIGLGQNAPGLAVILILAWMLSLGIAVSRRHRGHYSVKSFQLDTLAMIAVSRRRRRGHYGLGNALLAVVLTIGMVLDGLVVLVVALIALFLIVCFAGGLPNFH
jgi:hypothetical protein